MNGEDKLATMCRSQTVTYLNSWDSTPLASRLTAPELWVLNLQVRSSVIFKIQRNWRKITHKYTIYNEHCLLRRNTNKIFI